MSEEKAVCEKVESEKASNKKTEKGSRKINAKEVALITAIIVAVGACGYIVYDEVLGNKTVKNSRGSVCTSTSTGSNVAPDLNPSEIVDDIIEPQKDEEKNEEEENKDDQAKQDDSQKDNNKKKDTSNLPVIDGEKGSAELPGAKGFVASTGSYKGSVFFVTKRGNVYYVPRYAEYSLNESGTIYIHDGIEFETGYVPGVFGKYVLKYSDFSSYSDWVNKKEEFTVEAYKLDLKNIVYFGEIEMGQRAVPGDFVGFVDKDGNFSVFRSMPIYVGGNPEYNYDRGKAGMIKNMDKYKNAAALRGNTGTGAVYTMIYHRDGSQSVLEYKDLNVFNDPNWDL